MSVNKRNSIIVDTSFFIALAKSRDKHNGKAKKLARTYSKKEWITTWPVITELGHLLSSYSFQALLEEQQKGLFQIFSFSDDHIPVFIDLMKKYNDHEIDLADLSLIVLAEELGHGQILSFDERDFSFLKWNHSSPFENLSKVKETSRL